jgi:hypothetical protein
MGLQVPASAQTFGSTPAFTCVANAGVPPIVRSQGVTELVGDLVLNCTGGTPTATGTNIPLSNVQIFLNTNVTSRLLNSSNLSEATLLIDEPYPSTNANPSFATSVANAPQTQLACQAVNSTNCAIAGVGTFGTNGLTGVNTPGAIGPVGSNGPYSGAPGHYNVFQGLQNGANQVVWLGVPIDAPGTNGAGQLNTRVIRITNVRANACLLGLSSTLVPTQIVMYVAVNGSQQVSINNPQQTVAFIQNGFASGVSTGTFTQCNNLNGNLINSSAVGVTGAALGLTATEGFASSFKVRNYNQTVAGFNSTVSTANGLQNVPGFSYNTESGFYPGPITGIVGTPGLADTGTQISFNLAGIGAGVNLFVPTVIPLYPAGTSSAAFTTSSPGTATGLAVLVSGTSGTTSITPGSANLGAGSTNGNVVVSGTTGTITYEIVYSNPNVIESLTVPLTVAFISNTSQNLPGVGQSTTAINFAPLSTSPTASSGPIPRFCQNGTPGNTFVINTCTCNLLFPFVTNQSGFDTGIAIANTSMDPFGTTPQTGIVTLNYYGGTTGGGAPPASQKTSAIVPAGQELVFTLSNGGGMGIAATPGFQGYMIATASFQYCHGFAFISDLGAQKLAEGYLAIQLDTPGLTRTGIVGENKGH